jgi:O-antigen/teichoic acid export membrane protein
VESIIPLQENTRQVGNGTALSMSRLASPTLLARNATLNLLTEGWTFLVIIVVMPRLVSYLGETSFGLFSLAWVVIGYLTFLDIGVSKAATKYISEHLAQEDIGSAREVIRTALVTNFVLGVVGGIAFVAIAPLLISSVVKVSAELSRQAWLVFCIVGVSVPVLLMHGALRAILSSFQCFGRINSVNALVTTIQWVGACWLAWEGYGIVAVVLATVITRTIAVMAYGILLFRLLPSSVAYHSWSMLGLVKLLRFGGWVSVSQLVGPVLVYLDRILIASFVSLVAVTQYTIPYEAMTRLRIIPTSFVNTLYPAFSERGAEGKTRNNVERLYGSSIRYLLLVLLPGVAFLLVLGPDILTVWMGRRFSDETSLVLQILAVGVLLNALAYVPYSALQALGRPDLPAKFHVLQLPFHVLLCVLLIPHWGIFGAAVANTARVSLDAGMLFWAAHRFCDCSFSSVRTKILVHILVIGVFLCLGLSLVRLCVPTMWGRFMLSGGMLVLYFLAAWIFAVDRGDKPRIGSVLKILVRQPES